MAGSGLSLRGVQRGLREPDVAPVAGAAMEG